MKCVFILLCSVVVMMAGCGEAPDPINESGEVTATTATTTIAATTTTTITTEPPVTAEAEKQTERETYEYKGIVFLGRPQGDYFYVFKDSLYETEEGLNLLKISQDVATVFLAGDLENLLKYFDNDGYIKEQTDYLKKDMESDYYVAVELDDTDTFYFNHMAFGHSVDFFLSYFIYSEKYDGSIQILIEMYLNENREWKVKFIRTTF